MSIFHPVEIVDCGSETQLQSGENYSYLSPIFCSFQYYTAGPDGSFVSMGCTRFESRSGRIFVIVVVHLQCSKLSKGLECTVLPMVLCTIKNP